MEKSFIITPAPHQIKYKIGAINFLENTSTNTFQVK